MTTWLAAAGAAVVLCGGCDERDEAGAARVCERATQAVTQCFGEAAGASLADDCDPETAEPLADASCETIAAAILDRKADDTIDAAIRDAVTEALREAIGAGLSAALQQVLAALGGDGDGFRAYLMLGRAATEQEALVLADGWASTLRGHAGFDPQVRSYSDGFAVVHAPCVLELGAALPELVAELVLVRPDTIAALGGTWQQTHEDATQRSFSVHLPLTLLPRNVADIADPSCP